MSMRMSASKEDEALYGLREESECRYGSRNCGAVSRSAG